MQRTVRELGYEAGITFAKIIARVFRCERLSGISRIDR